MNNETQNTSPACDYVAVRWDALDVLLRASNFRADGPVAAMTITLYQHCMDELRQALTNPNPNMVVVPKRPTKEMMDAGMDASSADQRDRNRETRGIYKAMLAARPQGEMQDGMATD